MLTVKVHQRDTATLGLTGIHLSTQILLAITFHIKDGDCRAPSKAYRYAHHPLPVAQGNDLEVCRLHKNTHLATDAFNLIDHSDLAIDCSIAPIDMMRLV